MIKNIINQYKMKKFNKKMELLNKLRAFEREGIILINTCVNNVNVPIYEETIDGMIKTFMLRWSNFLTKNQKLSRLSSDDVTQEHMYIFCTHLKDYFLRGAMYVMSHKDELDKEFASLSERMYDLYQNNLPEDIISLDSFDGLRVHRLLDELKHSDLPNGFIALEFVEVFDHKLDPLAGHRLKIKDIICGHDVSIIVEYAGRDHVLSKHTFKNLRLSRWNISDNLRIRRKTPLERTTKPYMQMLG